jgi:hypothetical protein
MGFVHGKNTIVTLAASDISAFCNNSDYEESADEHDVTCYGKNSHVFTGGLKAGKFSVSGVYETKATATSPRTVIKPLLGTIAVLAYKPEGSGTGKPLDTVNVLVKSYKESAPVADNRMWTAEFTMSDDVVTTTQA